MLTRREFLKKCRDISILLAGTPFYMEDIANGFMALAEKDKPRVVFFQSQCCTGCSISTTYGNESDFIDFLTNLIKLQIHPNLSFAQGHNYIDSLKSEINKGGYVLIFEGSIPKGIKKACMFDEEPVYDFAHKLIANAKLVISSGTCSSYGGIPASNQNVTGAIPVEQYMEERKISTPSLIKTPGCPVNPDRLMGTVAFILGTGKLPKLEKGKPSRYYGELIHDHCGRFKTYTKDSFVNDYSDEKKDCLLKKGCRGPITYSDCPARRWNGKVNVCIDSNTPCIGCINENFPFNEAMYLEPKLIENINWHKMKELIE